jgi:hypothetical protein
MVARKEPKPSSCPTSSGMSGPGRWNRETGARPPAPASITHQPKPKAS